MTITNGYCTLAELKARLLDMRSYTATTISFDTTADTIADTGFGLRYIKENDVITVSGSTSNDGTYTVASVTAPGSFTVDQNLTTEAAGDTVTIALAGDYFDDDTLENVIMAASRHIDDLTHRWFYSDTQTRYYTPELPDLLYVDDLLTVTTLKTDEDGDGTYETTWTATTHYNLLPYNASTDGKPYTMIERAYNGSYSFPLLKRSVQLVGSFGYSATTPQAINEACLLMAARLFKRKDAPFGVIGSPDVGELRNIRIDDPDVARLLPPFVRIL